MTNNTSPADSADDSTDTSGNDEANGAMEFAADIEAEALDASTAFRNSSDKKYIYDGRGRRPSTIL